MKKKTLCMGIVLLAATSALAAKKYDSDSCGFWRADLKNLILELSDARRALKDCRQAHHGETFAESEAHCHDQKMLRYSLREIAETRDDFIQQFCED